MPGRQPGEQDRDEVGTGGAERREVGEHLRVEDRQQAGELGMLDVLEVAAVAGGLAAVPVVLRAERDDHLVEERVAEPRDLHPRTRLDVVVGGVRDPQLLAARGAQIPSTAVASWDVGRHRAVLGELVIGTWIAIVWTLRVLSESTLGSGSSADGMPVLIRWRFWNGRMSPRSKIAPRSTKKPSLRWPQNTVSPLASVVDGGRARARVVRGRARPDVAGRAGEVAADHVSEVAEVTEPVAALRARVTV